MFLLEKTQGRRRWGTLATAHGAVKTPCFMPIATVGAVKTLSAADVRGLGALMVLANTYHLMLRPGKEVLKDVGGLHRFMGWAGPILTDSGGYQVFSLSRLNKTDEDGVIFRSHVDGSLVRLTPELSIEMQMAIGSDIFMSFDDVATAGSSRERVAEAMNRSLRWAKQCKDVLSAQHSMSPQLFGIIQGGTFEDLRQQSARALVDINFDGYAIGGLSVGEAREDAYRVVSGLTPILPPDRPRYFMGGGMPEEIVYYVHQGVDMFDCVLPTRNARHGTLFVWRENPAAISWSEGMQDFYERLHITNERFVRDDSPVDPLCDCLTCQTTSRAYLRHLFSIGEMLGYRLATMHNLRFYLRLMEALRV